MSILVKGMEMPAKCGACNLFHAESPMYCMAIKKHKTPVAPYGLPRPDWCPLEVQPEREKGEWVHGKELSRSCDGKTLYQITYEDWHCNKCGLAIERSEKPWYKFCPNCGCRMGGESK